MSTAPVVASAPLPAVADDDGERATAARLERVAGLLLRHLRSTRPGDLTRSQASLLWTVRDHGPLSLAELADLEVVQAPTASRAVDLLVRRGLLRREIDPADHRRHVIDLAPGTAPMLERRSREAVTALATELGAVDASGRAAIATALPALEGLVERFGRS